MVSKIIPEDLTFLRDMALDQGAVEAKIITTDQIVVEDRIVFKCRVGCVNYGKTLSCPPHTPTAEEFRKIVNEYTYALFIKFVSNAKADTTLSKNLSKPLTDPSISKEMGEKMTQFWALWNEDKLKHLSVVLDLEKTAIFQGYPLATGLVAGYCQLCEKCTLDRTTCSHPTKSRYSEEAVGVNVQATAKNVGITYTYPFKNNPESFAVLLIN
jgi:predicted metal-binding protein